MSCFEILKQLFFFANDTNIFKRQLNDKLLNCNHKKYLLADAGYDSQVIRNTLIDNGYQPIITYNKRNTKNIK